MSTASKPFSTSTSSGMRTAPGCAPGPLERAADVHDERALRDETDRVGGGDGRWPAQVVPQAHALRTRIHGHAPAPGSGRRRARADAGLGPTPGSGRTARRSPVALEAGGLRCARVRQAQHLLETTDHSVERIAGQAGFGSPTAFRERCERTTGVSPHAYRRTFG